MNQNETVSSQWLTEEQQTLVIEHLGMARNLAHCFRHFGVEEEDLRQEGALGLCEAALRFDAAMGVRFETYAYLWCRKMILTALQRENRMLHSSDDTEMVVDNEPDNRPFADEDSGRVSRLLGGLSLRERQVIDLLYGFEEMPGEEHEEDPCYESALFCSGGFSRVGRQLGLSRLQVKRLHDRALRKMQMVDS